MCAPIDEEDPAVYYGKVADELERIAQSVTLHPELDDDLSQRLLDFAEQIRRDSGIACAPPGCTIN